MTKEPDGSFTISIEPDTGEAAEPLALPELILGLSHKMFPPPEFNENGEHLFPITWMGKDMYSAYSRHRYQEDLKDVGRELMRTGLTEAELPEFAGLVMKINAFFEGEKWQDAGGLKATIHMAKNVDQAKDLLDLVEFWKHTEEQLVSSSQMTEISGRDMREFFAKHSGVFISPERPRPDNETSKKMIPIMLDFYQVWQKIPQELPNEGARSMRHFLYESCITNQDTVTGESLVNILQSIAVEGALTHPYERFIDVVGYYAMNHGLSQDVANNLINHLYPAIIHLDRNVEPLWEPSNSWAMDRGEFAIGEYTCQLYTTQATPEHINELMLINSEIPTAFAHQFEQNRRDGLSLTSVEGLGQLKEAIHDQRPFNHQVVRAMVDFFDNKIDEDGLKKAIKEHEYLGDNESFYTAIIDRKTYNRRVEQNTPEGRKKVRVVDVLRRLVVNTAPVPDVPPETENASLDTTLLSLAKAEDNTVAQRAALSEATRAINNVLENLITNHQIGIDSRIITAVSYVDRAIASTIRGLTFEEQVRAYRSEWFTEVLRFHDLTASPEPYDPATTQETIRLVQQEHTQGAYNRVGVKVIKDMDELRRRYKARGFGRWGEMLWSGNTSYELIGMLDLPEPSTPEGLAYREKFLAPMEERLKGD